MATPSTTARDAASRADLVTACRILDGAGLTDAFGHVSSRDGEDGLLISPRIGPGLVRSEDELLGLGLDGSGRAGDASLIPGEAPLHWGLMRARPDVGSVVRFHGPSCFAWSTLGRPLPATTGIGLMVGAPVPVHDTALTITSLDAASALAETLGDGAAVLLRGFGAVTVGATVAEAVVRAWFLERSAALVLAAIVIAEPRTYTREQGAAFAARRAVIDEQVARAWAYLGARHGAAPAGRE
jgi:ribulose-5-phosphate 4-epimerase/fuculose-1-phosphate aldolase